MAPGRITGLLLLWTLGAVPAVAQEGAGGDRPSPSRELVVSVVGQRVYHSASCPMLRRGTPDIVVRVRGEAEASGLTPHEACVTTRPSVAAAARSEPLWLDVRTRRYHRAGCGLIGLPRTQITLSSVAAKKYRPCRACKPPTPPAAAPASRTTKPATPPGGARR